MMKSLPSMRALATAARTSFLRFPETVVAGVVAAVVGMLLVRDRPELFHLPELMATLVLGIPLTFAAVAVAEAWSVPDAGDSTTRARFPARMGGITLVAGLLVAHYASGWLQTSDAFSLRFVIFAVSAHLAVAFLPYLGRGHDDAFWEYNHQLFERFSVAGIYSTVLFAGLAIALGTAQALFGWKLQFDVYARLWMAIAFAFNTWYFVGELRSPLAPAGAAPTYPHGLRVFTQFLLLPLVALYLLILYAYMAQIVIQRDWPRGTVGWMVSGLSAVGMLAFLLVHPIRDASDNRWVRTYARRFFASLLPLIGLLLLATWRRVREYGFTEPRYLLVALGLWIGAISVYFLARRRPDIRVVPVSLCAMLLLTTFGPWGAASVSARDQIARLSRRLERLEILRDGRVHETDRTLPLADRKAIHGALNYLNRMHRGALRGWFGPDFAGDAGTRNSAYATELMLDAMGLPAESISSRDGQAQFNMSAVTSTGDSAAVIPIAGYDAMVRITLGRWSTAPDSFRAEVEGRPVTIHLQDQNQALKVVDDRETLFVPVQPLIARLLERPTTHQVPPAEMLVMVEGQRIDVAFAFESIIGREESPSSATGDTPARRIDQFTATVLFRVK